MTTICGIDEAGRGPVIGPLVMCALTIDKKDEKKLIGIGVRDSKQLSPKQREEMFSKIKAAAAKIEVIVVSPQEIDKAVESEETNLNWLEADHTIEMINNLAPDIAYIDCPSNNINAYSNYLRTKLKAKTELHADHKADEKYPVVSAASIIAKVTRDREIEKIHKKIGEDFGSGYPADPTTRKFLEENWKKFPEIFRKSWASYKEFSKKKGQRRLGEY
ncbi:ribonuclease HII [Candidatus Woesearchaeota archaeon CG10_big_fil_rev_8_21_14_0_10_44_13]|nr:MAG: ribonuclease HII [Candidatus Woesearchaeota archaeon CG10_big_fil_rev_8_21_14_0_10_44_13]